MSRNYHRLQKRLYEILEPAVYGDKTSRNSDLFFTALVVVNVISVTLESVPALYENYQNFFRTLEIVSVIIFTIEYFGRLWSAPSQDTTNRTWLDNLKYRISYIFSFNGLVDLISILPFYLQSIFPYLDLRILRTLRLLRILKLSYYNSAFKDLFEAIFEERKSFYAASYLFIVVLIVSSSLIYFAEHKVHPTGFQSIPGSMYWALITLTTVGYGDITPVTGIGQFIAMLSAVFGVVVVALITGIVASSFNSQMERRKIIFEDQVRQALLDGVLDQNEKDALESLRKRFGMSKRRAEELINQLELERNDKSA
ncbi:MAG: ion transporter, partial [Planktomarina sp.]|nr:ion transporter [Planktomarina sp.]